MKRGLVFAAIAGLLLTGCGKHVLRDQEAPRNIVGIGVMVEMTQGRPLTIIGTVSNTPAFQAGLTPGLVIQKIDGTPPEGMTLKQIIDKMRGVEGTKITLELFDPKDNTTNTVTLTREKIALPTPKVQPSKPTP
jgi:carboxyl-terminal processing protease